MIVAAGLPAGRCDLSSNVRPGDGDGIMTKAFWDTVLVGVWDGVYAGYLTVIDLWVV